MLFVLDQILRIFMAVARSDIEVRLNTVSWLVSTDWKLQELFQTMSNVENEV